MPAQTCSARRDSRTESSEHKIGRLPCVAVSAGRMPARRSVFLDQLAELRKQRCGIVRSRRSFRLVLPTENRFMLMTHAFNALIVEVNPVDGDFRRQTFRVNGKAMVLRGNLDFAGFKIFDRLIGAAMAKFELEGFAAKSLAEDLVAETNAEYGDAGLSQFVHGLDGVIQDGWISGAIGEKHSGGLAPKRLCRGRGGGQNAHSEALLAQPAQDVVLHPVIVRHNRYV